MKKSAFSFLLKEKEKEGHCEKSARNFDVMQLVFISREFQGQFGHFGIVL